ncbi:hypothetical protein QQF64_035093 [Cirrhinus molitorella]|uniref:Uncharacterized protein n=1 Tax=Cirrhinus molitorella TaxID=172907 RepID=A0ABR3NFL7_9TELE
MSLSPWAKDTQPNGRSQGSPKSAVWEWHTALELSLVAAVHIDMTRAHDTVRYEPTRRKAIKDGAAISDSARFSRFEFNTTAEATHDRIAEITTVAPQPKQFPQRQKTPRWQNVCVLEKTCRHISLLALFPSLFSLLLALCLSGQTGKADSGPERAVLDSQRARQQKNNEAIVAVSKFLTLKPFLEE